ncbi:hypothetical protein ACPXCG_18805 [Gordonia sp. DT218]|uniref:hypothetical protein n=1 Tax=Gordonia sp. DT218 TaxID=3416659 RepID=UPI003CF2F657
MSDIETRARAWLTEADRYDSTSTVITDGANRAVHLFKLSEEVAHPIMLPAEAIEFHRGLARILDRSAS